MEENSLDLQTIVTNAIKAQRQEEMKTSPQLTLGELILKLEMIENKELPVVFDDNRFYPIGIDSWRGSYYELAIEYSSEGEKLSFADFLKNLKEAVGKTFKGYKGGDFLMGKITPIWVANYGCSIGFRNDTTAVIDVYETKNAVIIKTRVIKY